MDKMQTEEFRIIRETIYKLNYGKWWKCFAARFSWCLFIKYLFIYFLFLLSYKVIYIILSDYNVRRFNHINVIHDFVKYGIIYSFEFVILSIALMLVAFILLSSKIYSINQESVLKNLGIDKLPRETIQNWDYKLIYRPRIKYHRLAWIFISSICVISALIYLTNYKMVYQSNMPDYPQKQNWIQNLPSLVNFGLPFYERVNLAWLDHKLMSELRELRIPNINNIKPNYGYNSFHSFTEYMLVSKIVTTNILMIFFYVDLFILLPLFFKWINNQVKHLSLLLIFMYFSYFIIEKIIGCPEKLKYYNMLIIFMWMTAQVTLFFIANPDKYYRFKTFILSISNLTRVNELLYNTQLAIQSAEFSFIKSIFIKLGLYSKYNGVFAGMNPFRLIFYILFYLQLSFIFLNTRLIYLPSNILLIMLLVQVVFLFSITKKAYFPSLKVKEASKLIEDNFGIPSRVLDYNFQFKYEYFYNRIGLLFGFLFCVLSFRDLPYGLMMDASVLIPVFMMIDIFISIPFILPFIDSRLKHIGSIIVLVFLMFCIQIVLPMHFGFVFLVIVVTILLWIQTIFTRNMIIVNAFKKVKPQSFSS